MFFKNITKQLFPNYIHTKKLMTKEAAFDAQYKESGNIYSKKDMHTVTVISS